MPHHVTQRGNRQADVFIEDADRHKYLSLLAKSAERHGVAIWAYCLMSNHVHFVAVPASAESLGRGFHDTHQAYAAWLNRKTRQNGHLWQGRFFSSVLDPPHLWAAVRYVERNPVRAGVAETPEEYEWSSAGCHCGLRSDSLLSQVEMPWPVPDWSAYLRDEPDEETAVIRQRTRTGRPCGSPAFVQTLESTLGRSLTPHKRGPKPGRRTRDE